MPPGTACARATSCPPTRARATSPRSPPRSRRADRLEAALLESHLDLGPERAGPRQAALGLGLIRDGNGPRALETLVRYRGSVLAELFRGLGALRALQAEAAGLLAADLPQPARAALAAPRPRPNEPEQ